jgi:APA family basic amino acid/polyamine antiporter
VADNKIGFYTTTALVIANMIGTGVFTSLGFQTALLPSIPVVLLLWLCGGLIAICGGLSYIELARLFPGSGGEYHFIKSAYSITVAKVAGLVSVISGFSGPVALAGIALGAHLSQLLPNANIKLIAFCSISFVTLFHCFNLKIASGFQLITTSIKLLLIGAFMICGYLSSVNYMDLSFDDSDGRLLTSKGFFSSLVYVSFAYSGWNASIYIFKEIDQPLKNIKKSIIWGSLIVTVLYISLNTIFLKVIPIGNTEGVIEIGSLAASSIFGAVGGQVASIIISLLLVSTISAMVWTGPRVIDAMLPGLNKSQGSLYAVLIQYGITLFLLFSGTFEVILKYTGVALSLSSCIAVSTLFLRYKDVNIRILFIALIYIIVTIWSCYFLIFR